MRLLTALVDFQTVHKERLWRAPMLALCGLVLFFALHAKVAVYDGCAPVKATPSTASKLWVNSQKMQVPSLVSSPTAASRVALLCLSGLYRQSAGRVQTVLTTPPDDLALFYRRRFVRPPPAQA